MTSRSLRNQRVARITHALVALVVLAPPTWAQPSTGDGVTGNASVVRGMYNWIHSTGDAEQAFDFYQAVFGIELAASPFAGGGNPAPEGIRPVERAGSDPLVWNLTNTEGSRFRTVFMRAANTSYGLELSEFFDIPRNIHPVNPWDPGASMLIFEVRDLNAVVESLRARDAPFVTIGGSPLETRAGRSIIARDPDGYLLRVNQAPAARIDGAGSPGTVVSTSIGISVADLQAALRFYRDLLGFNVDETEEVAAAELRLYGMNGGELRQAMISIPGKGVTVALLEFSLPRSTTQHAVPIRWKIQDVGAPQFQLQVDGLDTLLERTRRAGYQFLSIGGTPIQRPFGRFVFAIDPDGVLVEFVEPSRLQ